MDWNFQGWLNCTWHLMSDESTHWCSDPHGPDHIPPLPTAVQLAHHLSSCLWKEQSPDCFACPQLIGFLSWSIELKKKRKDIMWNSLSYWAVFNEEDAIQWETWDSLIAILPLVPIRRQIDQGRGTKLTTVAYYGILAFTSLCAAEGYTHIVTDSSPRVPGAEWQQSKQWPSATLDMDLRVSFPKWMNLGKN